MIGGAERGDLGGASKSKRRVESKKKKKREGTALMPWSQGLIPFSFRLWYGRMVADNGQVGACLQVGPVLWMLNLISTCSSCRPNDIGPWAF